VIVCAKGLIDPTTEQATEAVETVIPIVIARRAEQDALLRARAHPSKLFVPRKDEPLIDLIGGRDRIGDVATENEHVAARQEQTSALPVIDVVGRRQHRPHVCTNIPIVTRVGG
jgi:hypothetical protein